MRQALPRNPTDVDIRHQSRPTQLPWEATAVRTVVREPLDTWKPGSKFHVERHARACHFSLFLNFLKLSHIFPVRI